MRKIILHPSVYFVLAAAVVLGQGELAIVLFLSLLLHELAHLMAAEATHTPIASVRLYPVGGAARLAPLTDMPFLVECLVALAGPVQSLALAGFLTLLARVFPMDGNIQMAVDVNLALGVWNLLPAYPLDGGRVLRAWLALRYSPREALLRAVALAKIFAYGGLALAAFALLMAWPWLSLALFAATLLVVVHSEEGAHGLAVAGGLALRRRLLRERRLLPVSWLAVRRDLRLSELIRHLYPGRWHEILVLDEEGGCSGQLHEQDLGRAFEAGQLDREIMNILEDRRD